MLTAKQQKICDKYKKRDEEGFVHCKECPLLVDKYAHWCRANSRYNRNTGEWEYYESR